MTLFSAPHWEKVYSSILNEIGAFGNVRVCWIHGHGPQKYAIKCMKKGDIIKSKHVDHIENEKKILERIDHPFIVRTIKHSLGPYIDELLRVSAR
jgi:serine/threonine protein kinase